MPREEVTTSYTTRTKPSTTYETQRQSAISLWSNNNYPWLSTFFPWQFISWPITTSYSTPRKVIRWLLTDYIESQLTDYNSNDLTSIDTIKVNKITTNYS